MSRKRLCTEDLITQDDIQSIANKIELERGTTYRMRETPRYRQLTHVLFIQRANSTFDHFVRFRFGFKSYEELEQFCEKYFTGHYALFSNVIYTEYEKDLAKFLFYHDHSDILGTYKTEKFYKDQQLEESTR